VGSKPVRLSEEGTAAALTPRTVTSCVATTTPATLTVSVQTPALVRVTLKVATPLAFAISLSVRAPSLKHVVSVTGAFATTPKTETVNESPALGVASDTVTVRGGAT